MHKYGCQNVIMEEFVEEHLSVAREVNTTDRIHFLVPEDIVSYIRKYLHSFNIENISSYLITFKIYCGLICIQWKRHYLRRIVLNM